MTRLPSVERPLSSALGTWLADITALVMVVFGLSGIALFFAPGFVANETGWHAKGFLRTDSIPRNAGEGSALYPDLERAQARRPDS